MILGFVFFTSERTVLYRNCKATGKKIQPKCLIFSQDQERVGQVVASYKIFTIITANFYYYPTLNRLCIK